MSSLVTTPPQVVYSVVVDYYNAHPKILPKPPFVSLEVLKGGIGAGTEILVKMEMFRKVLSFRAVVTEPDPGRILVETTDQGYISTFKVEPREEGKHSYVTFTTELAENSGISKRIEFWLTSLLLRPVYKKELDKLAEIAARNF